MSALPEALQPLLAVAFSLWGSPVTWLEIVAFALSLWMVACNMRVHVLAWPLAIVASLLYALLFAASRLYGEAGLQFVFILAAFWGWRQWLAGRDSSGEPLAVHRLAAAARWRTLALTLIAWPLLGLALARWTDTDVPFLDALPTAGSLTGQLLLARKLIENWAAWLLVNLFSVGLFAYKQLWLTVVLYALFAALSLAGWRAWRRIEAQGAHG